MTKSALTAVAASVIGALLTGCGTLEPNYDRPASPTPVAFPTGPAYPMPIAGTKSASDIGWRNFFTDSKLSAVIALALDNNRDLRAAIANIEAARAQYHVQRSDLFPTINASAGATYGRDFLGSTGAVTPGTPSYVTAHQFSTSVGVTSYEIDLFGRIRSLSHAALEQYLETEEARRSTQISLIAEVATDYLTLAADGAQLAESRETLTSSQASLDVTQSRLDAGVASLLDVSQAQTLVQQARADVARNITAVATDRNALNLVVGASVGGELLPAAADDRVTTMTDLPVGLDSSVLLLRPDVLEAEHTLRSANAEIGAARAAFFPTITLTSSGGTSSSTFAQLFKGAAGVWSFAPNISIPIFDGGKNQANLDYDKAERDADIAKYEKAIQTAFSEVANALARRGTIGEEIAADQALVDAADVSERLASARYERGADTYLNVLDARRTLYSAQQTLISARLTRSTNLVTLYKTLGGGVN